MKKNWEDFDGGLHLALPILVLKVNQILKYA